MSAFFFFSLVRFAVGQDGGGGSADDALLGAALSVQVPRVSRSHPVQLPRFSFLARALSFLSFFLLCSSPGSSSNCAVQFLRRTSLTQKPVHPLVGNVMRRCCWRGLFGVECPQGKPATRTHSNMCVMSRRSSVNGQPSQSADSIVGEERASHAERLGSVFSLHPWLNAAAFPLFCSLPFGLLCLTYFLMSDVLSLVCNCERERAVSAAGSLVCKSRCF